MLGKHKKYFLFLANSNIRVYFFKKTSSGKKKIYHFLRVIFETFLCSPSWLKKAFAFNLFPCFRSAFQNVKRIFCAHSCMHHLNWFWDWFRQNRFYYSFFFFFYDNLQKGNLIEYELFYLNFENYISFFVLKKIVLRRILFLLTFYNENI